MSYGTQRTLIGPPAGADLIPHVGFDVGTCKDPSINWSFRAVTNGNAGPTSYEFALATTEPAASCFSSRLRSGSSTTGRASTRRLQTRAGQAGGANRRGAGVAARGEVLWSAHVEVGIKAGAAVEEEGM